MSSHNENQANGKKQSKTKKAKVESVVQKKTRRSNRKNGSNDESQNKLPDNIPISDSEQLIIFHSIDLQTAKSIIQVPVPIFKLPKMVREAIIKVGQREIQLKVMNNEAQQLIVEARIKSYEELVENNQQMMIQIRSDSSEEKHRTKRKEQSGQSSNNNSFEQNSYLIWGKACWIGIRQVCSRTIKQTSKKLQIKAFREIVRVKTKDLNSDIFLSLNMKKKLECVSTYNGLINQGNTCYMNSYLQMLAHISQFKNLVYEASIVDETKFPATLQLLFYKLDNQQKPVSAQQLVKSFGWSKKQVNIQQDAQQFSCLFYDALERKLQEACPDPQNMSMSQLFEGKLLNIIQCLQVGNVHLLY